MPSICSVLDCHRQARYNVSTEKRPKFCNQHKEAGMVCVAKGRTGDCCTAAGCTKSASFNFSTETRRKFCSTHKEPGMVNVMKLGDCCAAAGCSTRASFNYSTEKRPKFCSTHKESGMVNVAKGRTGDCCTAAGCTKSASFNFSTETRRKFCSTHKESGMVNVVKRSGCCSAAGCSTRASFNYSTEKRPKFCSTHKESGMVNVVKLGDCCAAAGCTRIPSFNYSTEKSGKFCSQHKEPGMVNVVRRSCVVDGCTSDAIYGVPGHSPSFCYAHRPPHTMKHPKRKCHCGEVATHGETVKPERCADHSTKHDKNLVERECSECHLTQILMLSGKCVYCSNWSSARHAKEEEVKRFLDTDMKDFPYNTHDLTPQLLKECNRKERPDFMWDLGGKVVILEVDERQHETYPCECEQSRMVNISQAIHAPKTIWLRYNPDAFSGPESKKWDSTSKRLQLLKTWLEWSFTVDIKKLDHTISVIHLFFDDFQEGRVQIAKLS